MLLSVKYAKTWEKLKEELYKSHGGSGVALLNDIFVKSEHPKNKEYANNFEKWLLGKTCTLELRDLCTPFGEYWSGVVFSNQVDAIDSASTIL